MQLTRRELDEFRGRLLRAHYAADDMAIISRLLDNLMLIAEQLPDKMDQARAIGLLRDMADALEQPLLPLVERAHQRGPRPG